MATAENLRSFQELEDRLRRAYEANDTTALQGLLAPEWTMVEPSQGLVNRDRFLQAIKTGRLVHQAMHRTVHHVLHVNGVAIVTARGHNRGQYNGAAFDTEVWVQDVFRQEGSNWQCVATVEAPVACSAPQADEITINTTNKQTEAAAPAATKWNVQTLPTGETLLSQHFESLHCWSCWARFSPGSLTSGQRLVSG